MKRPTPPSQMMCLPKPWSPKGGRVRRQSARRAGLVDEHGDESGVVVAAGAPCNVGIESGGIVGGGNKRGGRQLLNGGSVALSSGRRRKKRFEIKKKELGDGRAPVSYS